MAKKSWIKRIKAAMIVNHFTEEDKRLAFRWKSCAIGEKFGAFKEEDTIPNVQAHLGIAFMYAVGDDQVYIAYQIYRAIQALA